MTLTVQPFDAPLGAAAAGIDPRAVDAADLDALKRALAIHGVLVLHDQRLTPAELLAFSRRFGEIEYHVLDQYWLPEAPEVYVISNIVENGKPIGNPREGFGWHTDLSYMPLPTAYTFLYGIETPATGADTTFCTIYPATDALPAALRDKLDTMTARHSYAMLHASRPWAAPLTEQQKARSPDVFHPMIRTHPITGRKGLYLGGATCVQPLGLSDDEGRALIEDLYDRATRPEHTYAHQWRPHDLVFWDNRFVMHSATEYDRARYRRLIHRTSVRGEKPY
ncbi:MAG: TauD/TfdA family dioxygenase [Proteobacteria bacterium]|nr:TauD/TfdA family dioxygenase [Pseudomonadota bacterium]